MKYKYFYIIIIIGITAFVLWHQLRPEPLPPVEETPAPVIIEEVKPTPEPKKVTPAPKPTQTNVTNIETQNNAQGDIVQNPKPTPAPQPTPTPTPQPEPQPQPIIIQVPLPLTQEPTPQPKMETTSQKNITFHAEKVVDGENPRYDYYAVVFDDEGKSIMSDVYFHANVDYKCKCGSKIPAERGQSIEGEIRYIVTGSSYPGENMGVEATAIDMVKSFPFAK